MEQRSSLIDKLTDGLPWAVKRPLLTEYNNRMQEIRRILEWNQSPFRVLLGYKKVVESLLATCLFYRYVLGYFQGAVTFYKTVDHINGKENDCSIKVGDIFILDTDKQQNLLEMVNSFKKIQHKYQLCPDFYEFSETSQFLNNCKDLLNLKDYYEYDTI